MGDEDEAQPESNLTWQKYFLKPVQSAEQVIVTEKANGEAAHLSARFIQDQFYLILGSKNVHLVIGKESDLDQYRDGRFKVSSKYLFTASARLFSARRRARTQQIFCNKQIKISSLTFRIFAE